MIQIKVYESVTSWVKDVINILPLEADNALKKLSCDATNLSAKRIVAYDTGKLRESIHYEKISEFKYIIISYLNYARFVEGYTRPHWVSIKKHPEILQWAMRKGVAIDTNSIKVYKSGYPSHGGGMYMYKTSQWIDNNIDNYIDRAIYKSIR